MATCLHTTPQPSVCEACARRQVRRRAGIRNLAVAGGVVAVVAGLVVFLQTRPSKAPPPPKVESDPLETFKTERLASAPCEYKAAEDLVIFYAQREKWQKAADVGYRYVSNCPDPNPMREYLEYVYKQIGQWRAALDQDNLLIAAEPTASDYWWWRGDSYAQGDQDDVAMVDFRQSLALNSYWNARGVAASGILSAADKLKLPCEADRAWSWFVRHNDGRRSQEAYNLHAYLQRGHACDAERGVGVGKLAIDKKLSAIVGTVKGELVVDVKAGTTVISTDYAKRAGIVALSKNVATTEWSGVMLEGYPARASKITVGKFSATNVEVLISDDLEPGDDGVLGFSFLWHFDWSDNYDQTLTLRALVND
ncbi:MAG TPA: retropepsin-like aspartic protease [Kofleriaceae bacterium]